MNTFLLVVIALELGWLVWRREQLEVQKIKRGPGDTITVKLTCDTSEFDSAITRARTQIEALNRVSGPGILDELHKHPIAPPRPHRRRK